MSTTLFSPWTVIKTKRGGFVILPSRRCDPSFTVIDVTFAYRNETGVSALIVTLFNFQLSFCWAHLV